jgi:hypothetical protein
MLHYMALIALSLWKDAVRRQSQRQQQYIKTHLAISPLQTVSFFTVLALMTS